MRTKQEATFLRLVQQEDGADGSRAGAQSLSLGGSKQQPTTSRLSGPATRPGSHLLPRGVKRHSEFLLPQLKASRGETNSGLRNVLINSSGTPWVVSTLAHTGVPSRPLSQCPRVSSHSQAALRKAGPGLMRQPSGVTLCAGNSDHSLPEHQRFRVQASNLSAHWAQRKSA